MAKFPTPDKPGWFWAKLVHPSKMAKSLASVDWEVVEVWDNNGSGDETFGVSVSGANPTQWIPDFIWGPEVKRPKEL